jgi:hypothetical protein
MLFFQVHRCATCLHTCVCFVGSTHGHAWIFRIGKVRFRRALRFFGARVMDWQAFWASKAWSRQRTTKCATQPNSPGRRPRRFWTSLAGPNPCKFKPCWPQSLQIHGYGPKSFEFTEAPWYFSDWQVHLAGVPYHIHILMGIPWAAQGIPLGPAYWPMGMSHSTGTHGIHGYPWIPWIPCGEFYFLKKNKNSPKT